jgi:hypothetical protein
MRQTVGNPRPGQCGSKIGDGADPLGTVAPELGNRPW